MNDFKSRVDKIVSESEDMLTALESIGPMYGIPATNMLESPEVTSLKVVNDHIITPCNVKPNAKAIMCAIGAVLDHISQRVDEKLNEYQNTTIQKNKLDEHIRRDSNPAKGTVIGRYEDSNGDEILVYDSGLVDMANTKEAQQKVAELRQDMKIPMYTPTAMTAAKYSYFSDEDDITVEEPKPMKFDESAVIDITSSINESQQIMDWISHYHDTTHLGYDMLQEQGFDFVKMTDTFIQEASSKKNNQSFDIKYMKFDNTHILKAIEYFNEAFAEMGIKNISELDTRAFINSPNYNKAVSELEKQFDCHLTIQWINDKEGEKSYGHTTSTLTWMNVKQNIHVSKSKGFQLNGLPIQIYILNNAILSDIRKNDQKVFGQNICSTLCHEIFHNIIAAVRDTRAKFCFTLASAMTMAASTTSLDGRRMVFEKFVHSLNDSGVKMSHGQSKKLIKDLCYISAVAHNERVLDEIQGKLKSASSAKATSEVDEYIKLMTRIDQDYKALERESEKVASKNIKYKKLFQVGTTLTCSVIGAVVGIPLMIIGSRELEDPMKDIKEYFKTRDKEEYYCDLFAGMYQLPNTFMIYGPKHRYTPNDVSKEQMQKIIDLEKRVGEFFMDEHPSESQRNYASMIIAKSLLEDKASLSPAVREYCEWIIANYSTILKANIGEKSSIYDSNEAKDLNKHLNKMVKNNKITVTEGWNPDTDDITVSSQLSVISSLCEYYSKQCDLIEYMDDHGRIPEYIQEGEKWEAFKDDLHSAKGDASESTIKRILMFIPRVFMAIIKAIGRLFQKQKTDSLIEDVKYLENRIQELEKDNSKTTSNVRVCAKHIVALHNRLKSEANLTDTSYANLVQEINKVYAEIEKLGIVKVDKSDNVSQIRAVLALSGYVLFTFDVTAYKKFMEDFDDALKKMDDIDVKSNNINFSNFSVLNINTEIDSGKYNGHFIYAINDFEKYMNELYKIHADVDKHCKRLTKHFESLEKSWKFRRNNAEKDTATRNIKNALDSLKRISTKIAKTHQWYTQDESRIRSAIKEERAAITKLSSDTPTENNQS